MSDTATSRAVLERYHEQIWEQRNLDALAEFVHDDFEDDSPAERAVPGPEYARAFFQALFTAFPNLHSQPHQLFAEDDHAAIRWTLTGTMTGSLWGMPPTGKSFEVTGIDIVEVRDGKLVRDYGGMADQLPKIMAALGAGQE